MTHGSDQREVIAFLQTPSLYGGARAPACVETHISVVFIGARRVLKLKRAVRFPYLDFSSLERRKRYCEAEVALNRRTAPRLYKGVLPVVRRADGELSLGGPGEVLDWVVEMARFDEDLLFDRMASRGALGEEHILGLCRELALFHRQAEKTPAFGGSKPIARTIDVAAARFRFHGESFFDPQKAGMFGRQAHAHLAAAAGLLEERRAQGFVRRCHGDLHLRNICLIENRPTAFDAIEFCDDFSCIDVLYDLSFLLMDLEHRGLGNLANLAINAYLAECSRLEKNPQGTLAGLAALPLFLSCRAAIRAHTGADAAKSQSQPKHKRRLELESAGYLDLALRFLTPVPARLVAIGGFSGSGKSTMARLLAPHLGLSPGAVVLRSDIIRKELFGLGPLERLEEKGYRAEISQQVFAAIAARAQTALEAGYSVVADAVYARPEQRQAIAQIAAGCRVPFNGFWLEAQSDVMAGRIRARRHDASDATPEVLSLQQGYDLGPMEWLRVDAAPSPGAILSRLLAALGGNLL